MRNGQSLHLPMILFYLSNFPTSKGSGKNKIHLFMNIFCKLQCIVETEVRVSP